MHQMAVIEKLLRAGEGRTLKRLQGLAKQVNALEADFEKLTDEELREETAELPQAARRRRDARRRCCPRRSPPSARRASAPSASGTSTCSSWAAPRCTRATSPR